MWYWWHLGRRFLIQTIVLRCKGVLYDQTADQSSLSFGWWADRVGERTVCIGPSNRLTHSKEGNDGSDNRSRC